MNTRKKRRDTQWDDTSPLAKTPIIPTSGQRLIGALKDRRRRGDTKVCEERHPVNQMVDAMPDVRREGNRVIVPVVEEKRVLVKKLVVTEEIHLFEVPQGQEC